MTNDQIGVSGRLLFSLKGWNKSAQGNALGNRRTRGVSPERAQQPRGQPVLRPFRAKTNGAVLEPRALPWAILLRPFGASERPRLRHDQIPNFGNWSLGISLTLL